MESTSQELEVNSSRNKQSRFSKCTPYDGSRLVSKQNKQLSNKFMQDSRASRSNEAREKFVLKCSRGKVSNISLKGKGYSQASDVEQLMERLKILEEETEAMKQTFIDTMEERTRLVSEIHQEFLTIHCCRCLGNQVTGLKSWDGSLIVNPFDKKAIMGIGLSQILQEDSNPCIVTRDYKTNMHFS
ncbi:uncharacterized protein LOC116142606 isoform X1 [Pistacia vera]|uniref:uncharacterized protein LOC116142606 isoform X1 n=1 Tax=Pistacia vera TaxID=55513 RepID=UPI0012638600|nr:uncharacterized protein LOC116142606 isoform X1 [Pistacia vera]